MFANNHAQSLREELKAVHDAYKKQVKEIDLRRIDCLRELERYDELFHSIEIDRKRLSEANIRLGLLNERTEKDSEGWKSAALRYQYLFEQMDRVGLQQSQDIFECYKDIEVPNISVREKNKYVTTHLTGSEIVDEIEENVIYDDDENDIETEIEILEIIERITDAFNVNDVVDDINNDDINNDDINNDDPTINIALNALNIVNVPADPDNPDDSNDSDDLNNYDEYDGLNELFREENSESTEIIFEIAQYPQELYEDYIDRLMNHINRQLTISFRNYSFNP
tara:strand:- start:452 stop:1297 length:846 start_codon:yes stop_codon:yes gene_type:complete